MSGDNGARHGLAWVKVSKVRGWQGQALVQGCRGVQGWSRGHKALVQTVVFDLNSVDLITAHHLFDKMAARKLLWNFEKLFLRHV